VICTSVGGHCAKHGQPAADNATMATRLALRAGWARPDQEPHSRFRYEERAVVRSDRM